MSLSSQQLLILALLLFCKLLRCYVAGILFFYCNRFFCCYYHCLSFNFTAFGWLTGRCKYAQCGALFFSLYTSISLTLALLIVALVNYIYFCYIEWGGKDTLTCSASFIGLSTPCVYFYFYLVRFALLPLISTAETE